LAAPLGIGPNGSGFIVEQTGYVTSRSPVRHVTGLNGFQEIEMLLVGDDEVGKTESLVRLL